jgi:quercetin dioxygenase-like cupin family protein
MRYQHYISGDLFGIRYWFESGESLPNHSHERESLHNIIVLKGRCRFVGETTKELEAGEVFDFDGTKRHTIEAMGPCEVIHMFLHGEPLSYKSLPASERSG